MFLDEKIGYLDIVKVVEDTCETHKADLMQQPSLQVRLGSLASDCPGSDQCQTEHHRLIAPPSLPVRQAAGSTACKHPALL
jgi:hypothetical protein